MARPHSGSRGRRRRRRRGRRRGGAAREDERERGERRDPWMGHRDLRIDTTVSPGWDGIGSMRACFLRWYEPDQVRRVCGWCHTLSARALPGGGLGLSSESTPRAPARRPAAHRGEPVWSRSQRTTSATISGPDGSLRVSWRRSGNTTRRTPGRPPSGSLAATGTIGSASPWKTRVGIVRAPTATRDALHRAEGLRGEPGGRRALHERVGEIPLADGRDPSPAGRR